MSDLYLRGMPKRRRPGEVTLKVLTPRKILMAAWMKIARSDPCLKPLA